MSRYKERWTLAHFGLNFGRGSRVKIAIRALMTFRGERKSWVDHTYNVLHDGINIIESIFRGTKRATWPDKYDNPNHWGILVHVEEVENHKDEYEDWSVSMLEATYGYVSIIKQFGDGILSWIRGKDVRCFRRIHLGKNEMFYNICAWLTSYGLAKKLRVPLFGWVKHTVKRKWGSRYRLYSEMKWERLDPRTINPDDIWDNVFQSWDPPAPESWTPPHIFKVVDTYGKHPPDIPHYVMKKIVDDDRFYRDQGR